MGELTIRDQRSPSEFWGLCMWVWPWVWGVCYSNWSQVMAFSLICLHFTASGESGIPGHCWVWLSLAAGMIHVVRGCIYNLAQPDGGAGWGHRFWLCLWVLFVSRLPLINLCGWPWIFVSPMCMFLLGIHAQLRCWWDLGHGAASASPHSLCQGWHSIFSPSRY